MPTVAVHRAGSGSPMVLIHGFSASWGVWRPLLPALERHHDVLVSTLLGHSGGPEYLAGSPAAPDAMADALERDMDSAGFERAHLVGNSLGGWLALELAARGRALSATALSPAGGWNHGGRETKRLARLFRQSHRMLKLLGPHGAQLMRRRRFRALADDNRQPVVELLDRDAFFEGGQILAEQNGREKADKSNHQNATRRHSTSNG